MTKREIKSVRGNIAAIYEGGKKIGAIYVSSTEVRILKVSEKERNKLVFVGSVKLEGGM